VIAEPDVTITDYGLALESGFFAWLLWRERNSEQPLREWFVLFFCATSIASLTGGTVHGFFFDQETTTYNILWSITLIAIGCAALAAWNIGARILLSQKATRWISRAAIMELAVFVSMVFLGSQAFAVAIINYLPPAIFLLMAFLLTYVRTRNRAALIGAGGMLLTFVAAGAQQIGIALHPRYLTHNAVYHVIQGLSLLMMFGCARGYIRRLSC